MERILFVDENQDVLNGLERVLFKMRKEWEMDSVASGEAALERLEQHSYSAIVSELSLSGITGIELMHIVRANHPEVARIIVSANADVKNMLAALETAHQFLLKPVDATLLKNTLLRVIHLMKDLNDQSLLCLINKIHALPSYPQMHLEMQRAIVGGSVKEIVAIIEKDPGLVVKVLQLANSPFLGVRHDIRDINQAVVLLGVDLLKGLVLYLEICNKFPVTGAAKKELTAIFEHSMEVANYARIIALEVSGNRSIGNDAFIGGMIHDVGKLILLTNFKGNYLKIKLQALHSQQPTFEVENELLGVDHARLGAYLLGLWGLPELLVETVAYHHRPRDYYDKTFSPVLAVYIANAIKHAESKGRLLDGPGGIPDTIDYSILEELNLNEPVLCAMNKIYDIKERGKLGPDQVNYQNVSYNSGLFI